MSREPGFHWFEGRVFFCSYAEAQYFCAIGADLFIVQPRQQLN